MQSNDGLWLFVGVIALDVVGLLVDYALMQAAIPTVTEFAQRNKWAAYVLVCWQSLAVIGLAFHFFGNSK